MFTVAPNKLTLVMIQFVNALLVISAPVKSNDVISIDEYVVFAPTITIVMILGTATDKKFALSFWVAFIVVVPGPIMVALATDELGIVATPVMVEANDRVNDESVLVVVKKLKDSVEFKTYFATNTFRVAVSVAAT